MFCVLPYAVVPFAPSPPTFVVLNGIVCFGSAFSAAIQSAALGIYTANGGLETGKLFGAVGIVQTVGYVTIISRLICKANVACS